MSDFYVAQANSGNQFEGSADDPPGRATITGAKFHSFESPDPAKNALIDVRNYRGELFIGPLAGSATLRHLDVSNTSLSDLGPFADRIVDGWPVRGDRGVNKDGLNVEDCPLVRPTVEIARQGPKAVRNYFRELAAHGEDYLYEAKVLILGEGGAGKTSLLRRLYRPDRQLQRLARARGETGAVPLRDVPPDDHP